MFQNVQFVTFIVTHLPLAPGGLETGLWGCWEQEGGVDGSKSVPSAGKERDVINSRGEEMDKYNILKIYNIYYLLYIYIYAIYIHI